MERIVYTDEKPYSNDRDLSWSSEYGDYVTVVDIETGIVYTGSISGVHKQGLGRDVRTFVEDI